MSEPNAERFGMVDDLVAGMGAGSADDFFSAGAKYALTHSAE
jgi:hypothetical protein